MDHIKLILGIVLTIAFTWILIRNSKRSGLLPALLRIDTVLGIIAGLYLVISLIHFIIL